VSRTFEVTLATGRPGERTVFIVADRVLRIEEPGATYERDVRAVIVQDDGSEVRVKESARETRRRFDECDAEGK
jgi:hypothetical protein